MVSSYCRASAVKVSVKLFITAKTIGSVLFLLLDILCNYNLQQHVSSPTHKGGNVLDLVITSSETYISDLTVIDYCFSDHSYVIFIFYSAFHVFK